MKAIRLMNSPGGRAARMLVGFALIAAGWLIGWPGPMVTEPLGLKPSANQDERNDAAAGVSRRELMEIAAEMPVGRHLQMQMRTLVRDLLDLPCRVAEQLVTKVGQGSRGRDLLPDLRDLLVIGVTAGKAVANHAHAVPGQPGLGPRLPVFLAE